MILDRYILKEHLSPFVFWTLVITVIMLFNHILIMMKMLVEKGVPVLAVLELFILMLPFIIVLAIPMAVLFSSVLAFSRFGNDSELVALKANGISPFRLSVPVLLVSLILSMGLLYFQDRVLPETNHQMKSLMSDIMRKKPALEIRERVFINDFKGLRIYIGEVDHRTSEISDILITDFQKRGLPRTVVAPRGWIISSEGGSVITLRLEDGEVLEFENEQPKSSRLGRFGVLEKLLDIDSELERHDRDVRGDREMSFAMLLSKVAEKEKQLSEIETKIAELISEEISIEKDNSEAVKPRTEKFEARMASALKHINKYKVELHKKIAISIACLPFVLIGIPLGSLGQHRKNAIGIILSLFVYIFYWACLIGGEDLADRGMVQPWLAMWIPNIVLTIIGISLFYRSTRTSKTG